MIQGTLYTISAPSGAGKSTLIQALIKTQSVIDAQISISYTTRAIRPNESHGKHYFFISITEFECMISKGEFLEYARVFGNYYGTSREIIEKNLKSGVDSLLDIDWQGVQQVRHKMPEVRTIFILPPSKEELARRLCARGQDSKEIISKRMIKAIDEMNHYKECDYLIINDDFNTALNNLKAIILAERLRLKHQRLCNDKLISKLLLN